MSNASIRSDAVRTDPDGQPLRLLHVHAHPDDESSKGAAVTARYVAEGVKVVVATCTGGERGSVLNPAMDRPDIWNRITEIRRAEMDAARAILGIEQVWLGFVDSGLPEGDPLPPLPEGCFALTDPAESCAPLVKLIRELRPHVITTYDERGGYPHPDHVMCHRISLAAWEAAADPEAFPELGEPWAAAKLYYHFSFHHDRMLALHQAVLDRGLDSPYAERMSGWTRDEAHQARITTRVPCGEWFRVRDAALLAHATQVDPEGAWFAVPLDVQTEVWPTEDFELAQSRVGPTRPEQGMENDLFGGVLEAERGAGGFGTHLRPAG